MQTYRIWIYMPYCTGVGLPSFVRGPTRYLLRTKNLKVAIDNALRLYVPGWFIINIQKANKTDLFTRGLLEEAGNSEQLVYEGEGLDNPG